jgi:DNA relaxase NicK
VISLKTERVEEKYNTKRHKAKAQSTKEKPICQDAKSDAFHHSHSIVIGLVVLFRDLIQTQEVSSTIETKLTVTSLRLLTDKMGRIRASSSSSGENQSTSVHFFFLTAKSGSEIRDVI